MFFYLDCQKDNFFGKNLKAKHKVTLCLVLLGILANGYLWSRLPQIPFVEYDLEQNLFYVSWTHIVVAFGTFIKILIINIFRKF